MTRKDFVKMCGILGIGLPFQSACITDRLVVTPRSKFNGKVIIVGAGVGGLTSGYLLQQLGIPFEILEASSFFGGRIKTNNDFADFPIPLGAEWIETKPSILREILNDDSKEINIDIIRDRPDHKFVNSSWYNFFEEHVLPSISKKIRYNTIVNSIDYTQNQVIVSTKGKNYVADKVIVSVPLKILQDEDIDFLPSLPKEKKYAIDKSLVWDGFKAFFEFSEKFYDTGFEHSVLDSEKGQKAFYDASYGQNSSRNVIGLFAVGTPVREYHDLSNEQLKKTILKELDKFFGQGASSNYVKHIYQNWNMEPFIKGGYMSDYVDWRLVKELGKPILDKVFFAGGMAQIGCRFMQQHGQRN